MSNGIKAFIFTLSEVMFSVHAMPWGKYAKIWAAEFSVLTTKGKLRPYLNPTWISVVFNGASGMPPGGWMSLGMYVGSPVDALDVELSTGILLPGSVTVGVEEVVGA